jgi:hypothetical protein
MIGRKISQILLIACILVGCSNCSNQQDRYHDSFFEDFSNSTSEYFRYDSRGTEADFKCKLGVDSPTESGSKILSFKIDPEDVADAGKGPEIISNKFTHFGSYATRLKIPDVQDIQPNVGAVVGYFTYYQDSLAGLSEIDIEWLLSDPEIIYVGTWTGPHGSLRRIGRTINMAKGIIYSTTTRVRDGEERRTPLTGLQNQPDSITPIEEYDASSQFYTYGFDWYPDRIRWWMIHPETADTVVLWDYQGSQLGIPQNHSLYRMNFWHTNTWPVETNPESTEKPLNQYELEVDWMSYDPIENQF